MSTQPARTQAKVMSNQVVISGSRPSAGRNRKRKQRKQQQTKTIVVVPAQPKKKRRDRRRRGNQGMTECARKYLACISRPFSSDAEGACLPFPPDRNSLKATGISRFTLTADASGNSFVALAPCTANDRVAFWYNNTSGTWPITVVTADTAPANYGAGKFTTLPYAQAQLTTTVQARIVSVGFRITYVGTVSNMAGFYFAYCDPGHGDINSSDFTVSNVFTAMECKNKRITDRAFEMAYTVATEEEHKYTGKADYEAGATAVSGSCGLTSMWPWSKVDINGKSSAQTGFVQNGSAPIIFGTSGTTPGTTFYVELIEHVEYVGKGASYGLTPSHNDHNAANVIVAASERAIGDFNAKPEASWSSVVSKAVKTAINEVQTPMGRTVVNAAVRAAGTYLGRRRGQLRLNN